MSCKYLFMNNIKVAYICHFSTPLIRSRAKLKSLWLGNLLRKVKGLPKLKYCDAGTWNEDFIKAFCCCYQAMVSSAQNLRKCIIEFRKENIISISDDDKSFIIIKPIEKLFICSSINESLKIFKLYPLLYRA